MKFKVGDLIKETIINRPKGYCVVVDKQGDNYVLYNNSLNVYRRLYSCYQWSVYFSGVDGS